MATCAAVGRPFTGWISGDVRGDEWGPFITCFHAGRFALDSGLAVVCGLSATGVVLWVARRARRGRRGGEYASAETWTYLYRPAFDWFGRPIDLPVMPLLRAILRVP
jgi:hypothetical protein